MNDEHQNEPTPKPKRRIPKGSLTMLGTLPTMTKDEPPRGFKGFLWQFWHQLSRCLITGVMVWVPLIVTLWVTWLVIRRVGFGTENLIKNLMLALSDLGERFSPLAFFTYISYTPGFGFLFILALFLTTGLVARYLLARKVIRFGEAIVERIPLINTVYRAVQQIRDVFVRRDGTIFQKVCLIEYPRPGCHVVAFVTSTEQGIVQHALDTKLVALFVPTTPNPTSGFLLYVPPEAITPLDITVEDAMKLIVSGGAYLPDETS